MTMYKSIRNLSACVEKRRVGMGGWLHFGRGLWEGRVGMGKKKGKKKKK